MLQKLKNLCSKMNPFARKGWAILLAFLAFGVTVWGQELIPDPHFQRGLKVMEPTSGQVQGSIQWTTANGSPLWNCAQWHSRSSLIDVEPDTLPSGWLEWRNAEKTLRMGPKGREAYDIYMGVDSNSEYGGVYRTAGQPWPHLLVQQRLSPPDAAGPGCPPLSELAHLNFHVEARLDTARIIKKTGYDANIHAAQFLIYFTVQNLNLQSSGYGKIIWLGVPVYDDRYPMPARYVAHDDGTETLIYTLAYENVADSSVHSGDWVAFDVDLLPAAKEALQEAWRRGYLQESKDLSDYKIGGMNLGWECPGLEIVAMEVRNLSLVAVSSTGVSSARHGAAPERFRLLRNFPNPFNARTTIRYELGDPGPVDLSIFDMTGRRVATLVDEEQRAGVYRISWDGTECSSGIYIYRLRVGAETASAKMLLLK